MKNKSHIENTFISSKNKTGKMSMIRKNTEIGLIKLGDYSYISGPNSYIEEAEIGKYCSIARNVIIGVSGHDYNWLTTSPILTSQKYGFVTKDIPYKQKHAPKIGNDVWIGMNSQIMRGVTIGDGAVIAAGSVVTKNIEPYSIVGGIPAQHIKYRYTKDQINQLLIIKWWDWDDSKIRENIHLFFDIPKFIEIHQEKYNALQKNP